MAVRVSTKMSDSYKARHCVGGMLVGTKGTNLMRTDLYGLVHKAQRYHLFGFARELSRANLDDAATRERLLGEVRAIAEMLVDHADNEERYIHPLFAALGDAASSLDDDHRALDARIAEWVGLVEAGRWRELYQASMRLIAEYLHHIDAEERAQVDILWPSYTDAELGAVMAHFKADRNPAAASKDLELMLPALSVPELVGMLRGVRVAVGDAALDRARRLLGSERWAQVEHAIGT